MRKRNLTQHHKNLEVKFKLDEKIEKPRKKDDFDILYSNDKKLSKLDENQIDEVKRNYAIEEKEQENFNDSSEEAIRDKKIEEDEEEHMSQPLLIVHRMSMKKIEMAKIRNNFKKNYIKKPEPKEHIEIDKERAKKMAQNFFRKKLKYFNRIRNNTENENNMSEYLTSQPKKQFNNILSNNNKTLEINTDYSQDKTNHIMKRRIEKETEKGFGFKLTKKGFKRLPTDIFQKKVLKLESINAKLEENNKEKKEKKKEKKEEKEEKTKKEKESKEQEENNNNNNEVKIEVQKIIREDGKNKKGFKRAITLKLDGITNNLKNHRNIENIKETGTTPSIKTSSKLLTERNLGGSRLRNYLSKKDLNTNIIKEIYLETEKIEEEGNLTSRGFRRKFGKIDKEGDSKLESETFIKVNKRIIDNKENDNNEEKEPVENKYKKLREQKEHNRIKTEDNIRFESKNMKTGVEKDEKIEKNEKSKENTVSNRGLKVSTRNLYKRRLTESE